MTDLQKLAALLNRYSSELNDSSDCIETALPDGIKSKIPGRVLRVEFSRDTVRLSLTRTSRSQE